MSGNVPKSALVPMSEFSLIGSQVMPRSRVARISSFVFMRKFWQRTAHFTRLHLSAKFPPNRTFFVSRHRRIPMKIIRLIALLFLGACAGTAPAPSYDALPAGPLDAGQCVSCSQTDPAACGSRPSACQCYPGPTCCCQKVQ